MRKNLPMRKNQKSPLQVDNFIPTEIISMNNNFLHRNHIILEAFDWSLTCADNMFDSLAPLLVVILSTMQKRRFDWPLFEFFGLYGTSTIKLFIGILFLLLIILSIWFCQLYIDAKLSILLSILVSHLISNWKSPLQSPQRALGFLYFI